MSSASLAWGTPALTAPSTGRVLTTWILQPVSGCRHAVQRVRLAHCAPLFFGNCTPGHSAAGGSTSADKLFHPVLATTMFSSAVFPATDQGYLAKDGKAMEILRLEGVEVWNEAGTRTLDDQSAVQVGAACVRALVAAGPGASCNGQQLDMHTAFDCCTTAQHAQHALPSSWRYAITPKCHATLHSNAAAPHQSGGRQVRHPYRGWSGGSSEAPAGEEQLALLRASRPQCVPGMRSLDQVCWSLTISHNPSPLCRPPCRCRF